MRDLTPFRRRNGLSTMDFFRDFFGRDLVDDFLPAVRYP